MLLTEQLFDTEVEVLNEGTEKNTYLVGTFMQADKVNRNKRIYPDSVMSPAVEEYVENYVKTSRAVGEAEHPETSTIGIDRVSHLITEIHKEGSNYIGKAKILGTPMGNLIKSLVEGGVKMGVSSRGTGATKSRSDGISEVTKYKLFTVDAVYSPSAPDAFVSTLVESEALERVFANSKLLKEFDEFLSMRKRLKESKKVDRHQLALVEFEKLLKTF